MRAVAKPTGSGGIDSAGGCSQSALLLSDSVGLSSIGSPKGSGSAETTRRSLVMAGGGVGSSGESESASAKEGTPVATWLATFSSSSEESGSASAKDGVSTTDWLARPCSRVPSGIG